MGINNKLSIATMFVGLWERNVKKEVRETAKGWGKLFKITPYRFYCKVKEVIAECMRTLTR